MKNFKEIKHNRNVKVHGEDEMGGHKMTTEKINETEELTDEKVEELAKEADQEIDESIAKEKERLEQTRAERRRLEREQRKRENRSYTYHELQASMSRVIKGTEQRMNILYSLAMAKLLNKEPFNYDKTKICETISKFYDEAGKIRSRDLTIEDMKDARENLGILIEQTADGFRVGIEQPNKEEKECSVDKEKSNNTEKVEIENRAKGVDASTSSHTK